MKKLFDAHHRLQRWDWWCSSSPANLLENPDPKIVMMFIIDTYFYEQWLLRRSSLVWQFTVLPNNITLHKLSMKKWWASSQEMHLDDEHHCIIMLVIVTRMSQGVPLHFIMLMCIKICTCMNDRGHFRSVPLEVILSIFKGSHECSFALGK